MLLLSARSSSSSGPTLSDSGSSPALLISARSRKIQAGSFVSAVHSTSSIELGIFRCLWDYRQWGFLRDTVSSWSSGGWGVCTACLSARQSTRCLTGWESWSGPRIEGSRTPTTRSGNSSASSGPAAGCPSRSSEWAGWVRCCASHCTRCLKIRDSTD